jgi:hypothetical protein
MTASLCALAALLVSAAPQTASPASARTPDPNRGLHRWIDFQSGVLETRYRYIGSSEGATIANQLQHKQAFKGALKLDTAGRYTIQSSLGTGNSFTGSWDPTGAGTGGPAWDFRVRRLYAQAVPVQGIELATGSFDALRGENTEITTLDNDAYFEGYRASVKRPATLYADEVSLTIAYLGDLAEPNVFDRFHRMGDHNYSQVLVQKRLSLRKDEGRDAREEIAISADWTSLEGVDTLRQGVRVTSAALPAIDSVRFENYQRVSGDRAYGFAIFVDKTLNRRLTAGGGFSHTDRDFPPLNGDRYGRGKRLFGEARFALRPELTIAVFYTNAVGNDFPIAGSKRLDLLLSYNVLRALQQARRW